MSKLVQMSNLRGGAIYAAARVAPTTARTWALNLGKAREGGHPRYDASDAVAVVLMRQLTVENGMAAAHAAAIVNGLRKTLPDEIARVVADQETSGAYDWDTGTFAVVRRKPFGLEPTFWMTLVPADQLGPFLVDQNGGITPTVISLQRAINKAIYGLERVLAGEVGEEPEDA